MTKAKTAATLKSGQAQEELVRTILKKHHNFKVMSYTKYKKLLASKKPLPSRLLVKGMPFTTIYGTRGRTEFWLRATRVKPAEGLGGSEPDKPFICRIECKNQGSAGSVDEKFPYLAMTLESFPEDNVILAAYLPGARKKAQEWLKKAVERRTFAANRGRQKKKIRLMVGDDLRDWARLAFEQSKRKVKTKSKKMMRKVYAPTTKRISAQLSA